LRSSSQCDCADGFAVDRVFPTKFILQVGSDQSTGTGNSSLSIANVSILDSMSCYWRTQGLSLSHDPPVELEDRKEISPTPSKTILRQRQVILQFLPSVKQGVTGTFLFLRLARLLNGISREAVMRTFSTPGRAHCFLRLDLRPRLCLLNGRSREAVMGTSCFLLPARRHCLRLLNGMLNKRR
jgi:hypothetical protein